MFYSDTAAVAAATPSLTRPRHGLVKIQIIRFLSADKLCPYLRHVEMNFEISVGKLLQFALNANHPNNEMESVFRQAMRFLSANISCMENMNC